jgi:dTDP-4-amino-4,6-dideoxygalactose transaminase/dTDP-4-dehydrorhamnose reductase
MAIDVNVESTRELASLAVRTGVRRFLMASSCSVYGSGAFEVLDEMSPTNPVSTYAESKLMAEHDLLPLKSDSFEPIIARPATLYGWSPRMRFDLAINQMVATAAQQGVITVFGGGSQWRPFLHVRDAARAFLALLEAPADQVSGEVFNVGDSASNYRILDLAELIAGLFDGVRVERAKDDDDLRSYHVQFEKFQRALDFRCVAAVDESCREIWNHIHNSEIDPFADEYFNVRTMKRLLATPVGEGGEPIAPRFIPLYTPTLDEDEEEAVADVLRSGWLVGGSKLTEFEQAFSQTIGGPDVVGTVSCTAALHLCFTHLGVGPGDEVITSPITWASTANTLVHMGAKPVFADINPATLNIDPAAIEAAITPKTRAIMPVHLTGQPCDMKAIHNIARAHDIPVVEDAAHALGAAYQGVPIGNLSDYTCFSFYAIKNITTIEGGAVAAKDPEAADHIRMLAANGMSATAWDRYSRSAAAAPPVVVEPGYKYLMGNVNAAMGLAQLKKFPSMLAARQRLARMYHSVLREIDEIEIPEVIDGIDHSWHLLVVKLKTASLKKTRDEIIHDLRMENIGSGVHFYGLHLHPYYADHFALKPGDFPHATTASETILSLPFYPLMSDGELRLVVDALKKVIHFAKG